MEQIALDLTEKSEPQPAHDNPHLREMRALEPFLEMLRLFGKRDNEGIIYVLAAVRSLLLQTEAGGIFTQAEMLKVLRWMDEERRQSVLEDLRRYELLEVRGQFYEIPDRVITLMNGLTALMAPEPDSLVDFQNRANAFAHLDETTGMDELVRVHNTIQNLVAPLRRLRHRFEQAIDTRSRLLFQELLPLVNQSRRDVGKSREIMKHYTDSKYRLMLSQKIEAEISRITEAAGRLVRLVQEDISANLNAIGEYLSPEQIERFLQTVEIEELANFLMKHGSAPKAIMPSDPEVIRYRGLKALDGQEVKEEPTGTPPVHDVVVSEVDEPPREHDVIRLYHEIMARLERDKKISLDEVLIKDKQRWPDVLQAIAFLAGAREYAKEELESFEIHAEDRVISVEHPVVEQMTPGEIRKYPEPEVSDKDA